GAFAPRRSMPTSVSLCPSGSETDLPMCGVKISALTTSTMTLSPPLRNWATVAKSGGSVEWSMARAWARAHDSDGRPSQVSLGSRRRSRQDVPLWVVCCCEGGGHGGDADRCGGQGFPASCAIPVDDGDLSAGLPGRALGSRRIHGRADRLSRHRCRR